MKSKAILLVSLVTLFLALSFTDVSAQSKKKTVHVKEYKKKDGTVVKSHHRAAPGDGEKKSKKSRKSKKSSYLNTEKKDYYFDPKLCKVLLS